MDAGSDDGAMKHETFDRRRSVDRQRHFLLEVAEKLGVEMHFHRLVTTWGWEEKWKRASEVASGVEDR